MLSQLREAFKAISDSCLIPLRPGGMFEHPVPIFTCYSTEFATYRQNLKLQPANQNAAAKVQFKTFLQLNYQVIK